MTAPLFSSVQDVDQDHRLTVPAFLAQPVTDFQNIHDVAGEGHHADLGVAQNADLGDLFAKLVNQLAGCAHDLLARVDVAFFTHTDEACPSASDQAARPAFREAIRPQSGPTDR